MPDHSLQAVNWLDALTLAAVAYGVWRGSRRGFSRELPSVVSWAVFFVTGAGLFRWTNRLLIESSQLTRQSTGAVGAVAVAVLALLVVRKFRARLRDWAAKRFAEREVRWGAVAGGLRWLLIATLALVVLGALPFGFMHGSVHERSLWGRLTHRWIWPALHHEQPR